MTRQDQARIFCFYTVHKLNIVDIRHFGICRVLPNKVKQRRELNGSWNSQMVQDILLNGNTTENFKIHQIDF